MKEVPNLFTFAPSELSQDAILCWLASWAHPDLKEKEPRLHEIGNGFLKTCLEKAGLSLPDRIDKLKVERQKHHIDILIHINEDTVIAIEDKVFSDESKTQLSDYNTALKTHFSGMNVARIYFKPVEQSDLSRVIGEGFKFFSRSDMLKLFQNAGAEWAHDSILDAFRRRLSELDDRASAYATTPVHAWVGEGEVLNSADQWPGFFTAMKLALPECNWGYVNNAAGGFYGFWSPAKDKTTQYCSYYVQLEAGRLCFKIEMNADDSKTPGWSVIRNKWHAAIIAASRSAAFPFTITKPARFGYGWSMTTAIAEGDFRFPDGDGYVQVSKAAEAFKVAVDILDAAAITMNNPSAL